MDAFRNTLGQMQRLLSAMSPSQRATLLVAPLLIIAGLGYVIYQGTAGSYTAASWGKVFTTAEMMSAEQSLIDEGLTDFHRKGQRLMVPSNEAERYNAALVQGESLPSDWAEEWEKQFENASIFSSRDQLQAMKDIALAKQLRRILRAIPDIEDGTVVWARAKARRTFGSVAPEVTATVNVLPKRGHTLSTQMIRSLRAAVATMVPDLSAENVTIFDQSTGSSHSADKEGDPFDSRLLTRIREFVNFRQPQIAEAVSYIPDVIVTVYVDVDNVKSSIERSQTFDTKNSLQLRTSDQSREELSTAQPARAEPGQVANQARALQSQTGNQRSTKISEKSTDRLTAPAVTVTEKEFIAAVPNSVQVSVSIPEDYYRAVALKRGTPEGTTDEEKRKWDQTIASIRTEVEGDVREKVEKLVPSGAAANGISVTSYERIPSNVAETTIPITQTIWEILSQWGGAVALGLFAIWALWLLNKSMPTISPAPTSDPTFNPLLQAERESTTTEREEKPRTRRDQLQTMVRENPEMAAAVISKWIQAAK